MRTKKRGLLTVAFLQLVAITAGAAVALGAGRSDAGVNAGLHCTRYTPSYLIRHAYNHADCQDKETMLAWVGYYTSSYGFRDDNRMSLAFERYWEMGLVDPSGNWYYWYTGIGTGFTTNGISSVQTKAYCSMSTTNVSGRCYTNWYD
jgi:hypothetical protein